MAACFLIFIILNTIYGIAVLISAMCVCVRVCSFFNNYACTNIIIMDNTD